MVDEELTTDQSAVELRPVSIDVSFEGRVYTFDVRLTASEVQQAREGQVPERVLPMLEARRLEEMWARFHEYEKARHDRWAPTLFADPERVAELERMMKNTDEGYSKDELEQWATAVKLSQPQTNDEDEWDRWYATPVAESFRKVMFPPARSSESRTPRSRREVRPRGRRESRGRARAPNARSGDDDPHELFAALAALIDAHGPRSARWLAPQVGRRREVVLQALHLGRFVQLGKGRSTTWDNQPVAPVAFRDAVWRARSGGAIDGIEALELLLEPPPAVLAMFAEVAA